MIEERKMNEKPAWSTQSIIILSISIVAATIIGSIAYILVNIDSYKLGKWASKLANEKPKIEIISARCDRNSVEIYVKNIGGQGQATAYVSQGKKKWHKTIRIGYKEKVDIEVYCNGIKNGDFSYKVREGAYYDWMH